MASIGQVDLVDPDLYARGFPHDVFRELRRHEPVSRRFERGGPGFWAVTRYADVVQVLRSPQVFSSWRGSVLVADPPPPFLEKLRESMMNRDPPDHTWLRRTVNKTLNPRRIAALGSKVSSCAHDLIAQLCARGRCDFAVEVAEQMPLFMISEILGVPEEDRATLYPLTVRMLGSEIVDPAAALADRRRAADEMRAYGAELRALKRARPGDDLTSELLAAEVDGRRLTDTEFDAFFMLLFNAGTDTTRSLLCYGLDLLIDRPPLFDRLRGDPERLPAAIEEMLRYESPLIQVRRTTTRDVELGGVRISEGDKVVVFFPSANRDDAVFRYPDGFDVTRAPNEHIAFGFGAHHCLGAPLARLEAKHVFREICDQWTRIERTAPYVPVRTNFIRGMRHMPLGFGAR